MTKTGYRRPSGVSVRLLVGVVLAGTLSVLDSTIVVPLLSSIGEDLGGGSEVSWLVAGYLLASTVSIPLWGRWMDLRGERTAMWAAVSVFLLGTIVSAMAPSLGILILGRVIQGLGAGGVVPLGQAVLAARCSSSERARLQLYYNIAYGLAAGLGPLIGGALVSVSWRWAFWLIVPFTVAVMVTLWGQLKSTPIAGERKPFDGLGSAILTVGLTALLLGIERTTWWVAVVGVLALVMFVVRSRHRDGSLIPSSILTSRVVLACGLAGLVIGFVQFSFLTYLPLLAQKLDASMNSGLVVIPLTVLWMTLGAVAGRIALRTGSKPLVLISMVLAVAAGATVALWGALPSLFIAATLVGAAAGLALLPALLLAQAASPKADIGAATSMVVLMRNFGGAVGVAVTALALAHSSVSFTMWMLAAVALLGIVPALMMPGAGAERIIHAGKDGAHAP